VCLRHTDVTWSVDLVCGVAWWSLDTSPDAHARLPSVIEETNLRIRHLGSSCDSQSTPTDY